MNFTKFLQSLFGNKSTRDMKLIQPYVEKVKVAYEEVRMLDNDQLRAKTKELQLFIHEKGVEKQKQIEQLKASIEQTPIDEREPIFNEIDKLDKEVLDLYEEALNEAYACRILHCEGDCTPFRRERGDHRHCHRF